MNRSSKRRDYHKYCCTRMEFLRAALWSGIVTGLLACFFYRSVWAFFPLLPVGAACFYRLAKRKTAEDREILEMQFKDCILSVAASLKAGYAVENAFLESREDMALLYGESSMIYCELEQLRRGLIINITLKEQLKDLAKRSASREIYQFAQIFSIAKRSGGNLSEIIGTSAELIGQRITARQERNTLLSGRRLEQTIMKLMPFGILTYVGVSTPGYFDCLYHNWQGAAVMTGCLLVYLGAVALGDYVMERISREL